MRIKTWIDRLTDEANLWLNGVRAEESGELLQAITYYLKDATECLKANSFVRAALSCSCAASCLERNGDRTYAAQLFLEAASIYQENANSVIGGSIRECIWCLQRAYSCLLAANDETQAREVYKVVSSLERRIDPFRMEEEPSPAFNKSSEVAKVQFHSQLKDIAAARAIEEFLAVKQNQLGQFRRSKAVQNQALIEEGESTETSFVNQLG